MGGPKWPRRLEFEGAVEAGKQPPEVRGSGVETAARPKAAIKVGELMSRGQQIDVLLIHLDTFYDLLYTFVNVGLLYIASMLKESGYKVQCLKTTDLFHLDKQQQAWLFQKARPKVVGFYTLSDNISLVKGMAKDVKAWLPETTVIVGGPLPSVADLEVMQWPWFDMAVRGEGEYAMLKLLNHMTFGIPKLNEIPGLTYREGDEIKRGAPPEINRELDRLPFPDHELAGIASHCQIVTSRGCPYQCTFCFRDASGKVYRYRTAENVMAEVKRNIEQYNVRTLAFADDTFTIPPQRVHELCDRLIDYRRETGREFIFFCEGRVDVLDKDPELLPKMREAGMARLQIGIETGDRETLKIYKKGIQPETVERVLRRCADLGSISVVGNFILGAPFESRQSFDNTLTFALQLLNAAPGVFEGSSCFLCPYPGTEIEQHPEQYGLRVIDKEFKKGLTLSDVHFETTNLDASEVRSLQREFEAAVDAEMWKLGERVPRATLKKHYDWARHYSMMTMWYLRVFSKAPIIDAYFLLMRGARFRALDDIPPDQLLDWIPMRVEEKRTYTKGGRIVLPGWFRKLFINNDVDRAIYEYSAGKLRMRDVADEVRRVHCPHNTVDEVVRNRMLPLYRRLEKTYHVAFFE